MVYEKGQPKYLLDFNRQKKPLIIELKMALTSGATLEEAIQKIGQLMGREWTTRHNIDGVEIADRYRDESIELYVLDDVCDLST